MDEDRENNGIRARRVRHPLAVGNYKLWLSNTRTWMRSKRLHRFADRGHTCPERLALEPGSPDSDGNAMSGANPYDAAQREEEIDEYETQKAQVLMYLQESLDDKHAVRVQHLQEPWEILEYFKLQY